MHLKRQSDDRLSNKTEYSPHDSVPTPLKPFLQSSVGEPPAHIVQKDGCLFSCRYMSCSLKTRVCLEHSKKPTKYEFLHPEFIVEASIVPAEKLIEP